MRTWACLPALLKPSGWQVPSARGCAGQLCRQRRRTRRCLVCAGNAAGYARRGERRLDRQRQGEQRLHGPRERRLGQAQVGTLKQTSVGGCLREWATMQASAPYKLGGGPEQVESRSMHRFRSSAGGQSSGCTCLGALWPRASGTNSSIAGRWRIRICDRGQCVWRVADCGREREDAGLAHGARAAGQALCRRRMHDLHVPRAH